MRTLTFKCSNALRKKSPARLASTETSRFFGRQLSKTQIHMYKSTWSCLSYKGLHFLFLSYLANTTPSKLKPNFTSVIRMLLRFHIWTFLIRNHVMQVNFSYHQFQSVAEASARPSGSKHSPILSSDVKTLPWFNSMSQSRDFQFVNREKTVSSQQEWQQRSFLDFVHWLRTWYLFSPWKSLKLHNF